MFPDKNDTLMHTNKDVVAVSVNRLSDHNSLDDCTLPIFPATMQLLTGVQGQVLDGTCP